MSSPQANSHTRVGFSLLEADKMPSSRNSSAPCPAQDVVPRCPEWTTRRWERRVEAEARLRLRQCIFGLGARQ